jgi:hypothetical protein
MPFTHVGTCQDKVKKAPFVCLETKNNNRLILLVSHENENPLPFFLRLTQQHFVVLYLFICFFCV